MKREHGKQRGIRRQTHTWGSPLRGLVLCTADELVQGVDVLVVEGEEAAQQRVQQDSKGPPAKESARKGDYKNGLMIGYGKIAIADSWTPKDHMRERGEREGHKRRTSQ